MSVRPLASHTQHERPSLETGTERRHDKRLESERPQSPNPLPPPSNKQPRERPAIEDDRNKIMAVSAKYARTGSVLPLCCGNNLRSTRARAHKNVVAVRPEAGTSEATTTTRTRGCTPTRHCTPEHRSMDTNVACLLHLVTRSKTYRKCKARTRASPVYCSRPAVARV